MSPLASILQQGLLDDYDSAFFLQDFNILDAQLASLSASFPSDTQHAVAIKTNPCTGVLSHILQAGYMLEAASFEELELAVRAGAVAGQLVFDSPVKRQWELEACAARWPGMIVNANNLVELERFQADQPVRLGLRINTLVETSADKNYNVSHAASKFGVPIQQRDAIVQACLDFPVSGLHMHSGSGVADPLGNVPAVKALVYLANEINSELEKAGCNRLIDFLDIGGGLDAAVAAEGMRAYGEAVSAIEGISSYQLITEFGQWVHKPAGSAFSQVESVDSIGKPRPQVFLHLGADLFVRHIYSKPQNLNFTVYDQSGRPKPLLDMDAVDLVGPLCFAGDVLAESVTLPVITSDDWVGIADTGANTYGLWSRHCSRSVPKIIGSWQNEFGVLQSRRAIEF